MKYAENNRISHRQLYHQIILSFLAPLLICIPGYNGEQGLSGAVGIMAAVLILLLYVFFLMRTSYCYADPVKIMGKLKGSLLGSFFLIYLIMTGVYILSLIEQIVPVWAVSGIATGWLIFWAVVVCAYGADHGMQRRGRMAGVSGGIFLFVIDCGERRSFTARMMWCVLFRESAFFRLYCRMWKKEEIPAKL